MRVATNTYMKSDGRYFGEMITPTRSEQAPHSIYVVKQWSMTCVPSTCDMLFYTASISERESGYELQFDADARS